MNFNKHQIEQSLLQYIKQNTVSDISKITPESLLFHEGVFDSMGFILLVDYLEENYNIKTNDNDLIEENFKSVSSISDFIQKKLQTTNVA